MADPDPMESPAVGTSHSSPRRLAVAASGTATVLVGIALLPLPGPGTVVILAGLTVLRKEFPAAGRAADRITGVGRRAITLMRRRPSSQTTGPWRPDR
jgi:hypothetical protein